MNDEHISIEPNYNPNPHYRRDFTVQFFSYSILTTVTSTPSVVRKWLSKIRYLHRHRHRRHILIVGLGVQWLPSAVRGVPSPPATLQLCVGRHCLIFQLLHSDSVPISLRRFLSNPDNTFVGLWNQNDKPLLRRSKHRLSVTMLVDIRNVAAERRGLSSRLSTETLAAILLGAGDVKKPESVGRSNWDAYWLSEDQVQYACVDAFLSFSMGKVLKAWNWEP